MSPDPESHEYDPRLFYVPLAKSPAVEPNITFFAGTPTVEVMRIDKNGVTVNPDVALDEAAKHVIEALSTHIQHIVNHAVAEEREACAKVCEEEGLLWGQRYAAAIRARGQS